jgi:hypothetical protein
MRSIALLILLFASLLMGASSAAFPGTDEIRVFNNRFVIEAYGNRTAPRFIFIAPHYNESIGAAAARELVENWGDPREAVFYRTRPCNSMVEEAMHRDGGEENDPPGRYLYFSLEKQWYCIDPNRIFTRRGIETELNLREGSEWVAKKNLKKESAIPSTVYDEVERAAGQILTSTGIEGNSRGPEAVVAVHNNSPTGAGNLDSFSLLWYKAGGPCYGEVAREGDIPCIYEGDPENIDCLFLVNRREDFCSIKKDGRFNVVLFKSLLDDPNSDDGSLAVYCERKGLRYINVESQHMNGVKGMNDKNRNYEYAMLELVRQVLTEKKAIKKM